jgi:hypothetical protein
MNCFSFVRPFAASIIALVLSILAAGIFCARAQSTSAGIITGRVTDPQGAVVAGATITVTDMSTGSVRTTVTSGEGLYVLPDVPPGRYTITAKTTGFAEGKISQITVTVAAQTTADFTMAIGSTSQIVEVQSSNADLQTMNASVSQTIDPVMVASLPSIGRDASTFAMYQPGVTPGGNVAGTVQDQSVYQLDGGNNSSDMDGSMESYTGSFGNSTTGGFLSAGSSGVMPMPQDSVEEFRVSASGQTADFNNSTGLQAQVVTKRGHDHWNGTLYEYYLDSQFGANTWQNNFPAPLYTPKPSYHYSRFGAAAGGPIAPVKFGGRTYLFANYEGFRYPDALTFERTVPSAAMMAGNLTFAGTTYTAAQLKADDPRSIGMDPTIQAFWAKQLPQQGASYPGGIFDPSCGAISTSYCDGVNTIGYKANLSIPQNSNFFVVRVDHDFGVNWHFMASYRYYKLTQLTANQVDIGGVFPGDKLGVPAAVANRPQQPWYFVAGLTTNISPSFTNDVHYSFLRNFWQWKDDAAPPQVTGAAGAIEPLGESSVATTSTYATSAVLAPFNLDAQDIRTRVWDGQDNFLRDDLSKVKGDHLIQFGGQYQHNFNFHNRTDNGNSINYTTTYQIGDASGGGSIAYSGLSSHLPTSNTIDGRIIDTYYGFVTDTQVANTYASSGGTLNLNPPLTPIFAHTVIPYYNLYATDTWHLKPSLTLNYGLSYAIEMPPHEEDGNQVMWVDTNNKPILALNFLAQRASAAASGQIYNPATGFSLIKNVAGSPKYPYNPFYGAVSPRVAVAWNPDFKNAALAKLFGGNATVIRGGYGRIYGRINGVVQVLNPLLSPGLILAVQCHTPQANGTCSASNYNDTTAFRFGATTSGLDGVSAPLATAPATLSQPYFPGYSGPGVAIGSPVDPTLRPNDVDTFNFSIQRQTSHKMLIEVGYIGRLIHHEYTMVNPNSVPYMLSLGGQSFEAAYLAVERALGCTQSASLCSLNTTAATKNKVYPSVTAQPFFEAALIPSYCAGYASCTAAVIAKQASNFGTQKVFSLWSALDNGVFNFPRSMMNTPIAGSAFGSSGQLVTGLSVGTAAAWSNYNGGYVSFKTTDFHGLTLQENLTLGKALGLNAYAQSTSGTVANDSYDLHKSYGVQSFDQKYIFNTFIVYQTPWYRGQPGILGRLAGGWTLSPVLTAGTGQPLTCTDNSSYQSFGGTDANNFTDREQCVFTGQDQISNATHRGVTGGNDPNGIAVGTSVKGPGAAAVNVFSNPIAVFDTARPPILGLDEHDSGDGAARGLPYLDVDLSVKKSLMVRERTSLEFTGVFFNVMNHLDFSNPSMSIASPSSWGVTKTQGNSPRQIQMGIRASF